MQKLSAMLARESDSPRPLQPIRGIDMDDAFDLLSNTRRRWIIDIVANRDGPIDRRGLADAVAEREHGRPASTLSAKDRKRVYIGVTQFHLDTLDDAGAIAFDGRDRIRQGHNTIPLLAVIDQVEQVIQPEVER